MNRATYILNVRTKRHAREDLRQHNTILYTKYCSDDNEVSTMQLNTTCLDNRSFIIEPIFFNGNRYICTYQKYIETDFNFSWNGQYNMLYSIMPGLLQMILLDDSFFVSWNTGISESI